jgi:hypothetical protein
MALDRTKIYGRELGKSAGTPATDHVVSFSNPQGTDVLWVFAHGTIRASRRDILTLVDGPLNKLRWSEQDLACSRKSDSRKVRLPMRSRAGPQPASNGSPPVLSRRSQAKTDCTWALGPTRTTCYTGKERKSQTDDHWTILQNQGDPFPDVAVEFVAFQAKGRLGQLVALVAPNLNGGAQRKEALEAHKRGQEDRQNNRWLSPTGLIRGPHTHADRMAGSARRDKRIDARSKGVGQPGESSDCEISYLRFGMENEANTRNGAEWKIRITSEIKIKKRREGDTGPCQMSRVVTGRVTGRA